jgi:hypothetical protein
MRILARYGSKNDGFSRPESRRIVRSVTVNSERAYKAGL